MVIVNYNMSIQILSVRDRDLNFNGIFYGQFTNNIIIVVLVGIGYQLVLNLPVSIISRYSVKEPNRCISGHNRLRTVMSEVKRSLCSRLLSLSGTRLLHLNYTASIFSHHPVATRGRGVNSC